MASPASFALPGERHKLAVVFDEENVRWAWPRAGLPSTHILKPESIERPGLASVEMACTTAYREMGLPVALPGVGRVADVPCFGSVRFDRWGDGPVVERLHQESFAQALGLAPDAADGCRPGRPRLPSPAGCYGTSARRTRSRP